MFSVRDVGFGLYDMLTAIQVNLNLQTQNLTPNPEPHVGRTLHSEPYAQNTQPQTPNPEPHIGRTLHSKPYVFSLDRASGRTRGCVQESRISRSGYLEAGRGGCYSCCLHTLLVQKKPKP
jgi:hypothetical protein